MRRERELAASGQLPAQPMRLALGVGQGGPVQLPPSIAKVVGHVRETRQHSALKTTCPWCRAIPGKWCEKRQGASQGPVPVAGFLHPSRCEAAGVEFVPVLPARDEADAR
jgi:hypothetical protein